MSSINHIRKALERQYALALGAYEVAEHAVEPLLGLKAVIAADERIQKEKKQLKLKMERIAHLLRVQVDPDWEDGHIRPIRLRERTRRKGALSIAAYKVLKAAKEPLRVREISRLIAPQLGVDAGDFRQIAKLDVAICNALTARLKDDMVMHDGGSPRRWSIKRIDPREQARAFADSNTRSIL